MDANKQQLLIEYLVSSPDTFALCLPIIKTEYWDPELRLAIKFIIDYYNEYSHLPDIAQIEAETGRIIVKREITSDKIEYCINEIEEFCKRSAIVNAISESLELIETSDYGAVEKLIKDAATVSLHRDMGINFFENPKERIERLIQNDSTESTGWADFDRIMDGGICRKQLLLFSANSGVGKSIVMANLGLNFVLKGFNVLLISLELSQDMVDIRFIQMVSGQGSIEWKEDINETSRRISMVEDKGVGTLHIKRMPQGTSSNKIRSYLKEFELRYNIIPDMIISDYLDLMHPNEGATDDVFQDDKKTSEQFREIGEEYNAYMVSASQQNREGVDAIKASQKHIAGGISKINTTDTHVSIMMNDSMRAQGEMAFQFVKTRTSAGVGSTIHVRFNPITLRITDMNVTNPLVLITKKEKEEDDELLKFMSDLNDIDII